MKKLLIGMGAIMLWGTACKKSSNETIAAENTRVESNQSSCGTEVYLKALLAKDPSLKQKIMAMEQRTKNFVLNQQKNNARAAAAKIITIPVVVNVLYRTPAENVSKAQIQSQIDVLNEAFSGTNEGLSQLPAMFKKVASGDIGIRFVLNKIVRKATTRTIWHPLQKKNGTEDSIKFDRLGGISATNTFSNLNIWVVSKIEGAGGYATPPGWEIPENDGVVSAAYLFGRLPRTNLKQIKPNRLKGFDLVHEVGHWLNLIHIWGNWQDGDPDDTKCGDDFVDDTPQHSGPNEGCSSTFPAVSACAGKEIMMTMNFMDYTYDCGYMFSAGQKARMLAEFAKDGGRSYFNK